METDRSGPETAYMLDRADLLVPLEITDQPSYVAVLGDRTRNGTALRIALYPGRNLVYCGLWLDGEMLLGSALVSILASTARVYSTGTVQMGDERSISITYHAHWSAPSEPMDRHCARADAQLFNEAGRAVLRLSLKEINDPQVTAEC